MRKRWLAVVVVAVLSVWLCGEARAEDAPVQVYPDVRYTFGEQILFRARFAPAEAVTRIEVFYRPNWPSGATLFGDMTLEGDTAFYAHDLKRTPVPPFAPVDYWFRLTLKDGTVETTPIFSFLLEDNRFSWQHVEAAPFRVYWYQGDAAFAQRIVDAAFAGLHRAQALWLAPVPSHSINIYAYGTAADLQSALGADGWVAGHASPQFGAVYVALPPGPQQEAEIRRLVPHELAHYLLYQQIGDEGYRNLPAWLNEGLASNTELTPNPDYDLALKHAAEAHALLPLADLCHVFPNDVSGALLAYAESASFTQFILERYGRSMLEALVLTYGQGVGCEVGVQRVLGVPLGELERLWKQERFRAAATQAALARLTPWGGLLGILALSLALGAWIGRR